MSGPDDGTAEELIDAAIRDALAGGVPAGEIERVIREETETGGHLAPLVTAMRLQGLAWARSRGDLTGQMRTL